MWRRSLTGIVIASLGMALGCAPTTVTTDDGDGTEAALTDGSGPALGATLDGSGATFRLWAPHATSVELTGSFTTRPLAMKSIGGGVYELRVLGVRASATYGFSVHNGKSTFARVDPYCRQLKGQSCVVVDAAAFPWGDKAFVRPAREAQVVYEVHVGSYAVKSGAANGTFATLRDSLDDIAELGANVVELMPSQDSGSDGRNWGYDAQLWLAPKPAYGTPDELRSLVDRAHQLGIAVWLDTVINHADGWSQAPLHCFDAPCTGSDAGMYFFPPGVNGTTPWGPRPNYADAHVDSMIMSAASMWLDEMHGDGFRWDSVSNIRGNDGVGTIPGAKPLLSALNDLTHKKGAFSVAEDLKGYSALTAPTATGGFGFDAQWDGFGYQVDGVLTKASDTDRDLGQIVTALTSAPGGDPFSRLLFTEDHDTVGNGGSRLPNQLDVTTPTSLSARKRSMIAATLLMTAPGVPMLFQGQDAYALGTFANPAAPLATPTAQGLQIRQAYKDLITLRRNLTGGAGGLSDTEVEIVHRNDTAKVLAYRRFGGSNEEVLVIVNLKNKSYAEYDLGLDDAGAWNIAFTTESSAYGDDIADGVHGALVPKHASKDGKPYSLPVALGAYGAMILVR